MTLGEKVMEALEGFRVDLEQGERIVVRIIERCICNAPGMNMHNTECHLCEGRGFLIDGKTIMPKDEYEGEIE